MTLSLTPTLSLLSAWLPSEPQGGHFAKTCHSHGVLASLRVVADPIVPLAVLREGRESPLSPELEEERLDVERAKTGDRRALARILRRHGPTLYRSVLLPRLGSREAAEEALAITYAKIVEKLDRFSWQHVGIYPWLRVVAMRVALDQLRARRREILFDSDQITRELDRAECERQEADSETLAKQDAEIARTKVTDALARIHPRYAAAIRMRILEERSREEVAQELGVTTATFDVVLHRALASLKKALSPLQNEQES